MNQCLACSDEPPPQEAYRKIIQNITSFLRGSFTEIKQNLTEKMYEASEQLNFERAKELRDQIQHIQAVMEQQKMILNDNVDRDVFAYVYDKEWMCVQVCFVRQGTLIDKDGSIFPYIPDQEDTFFSFVGRFYLHENHLKPQESFVPIGTKYELLTELLDVDVHTPFRGPKRKLVELAEKNAKLSLQERFTLLE